MGGEWKEKVVDDLILEGYASLQTGPFGTQLKASEYAIKGVPLISVREIRYGYIEISEHTPLIGYDTTERLPKFLLNEGDIVFGRKGGVDRCALIKREESGWFLGSDGIRLRFLGDIDSKFISYQLRSPIIQQWLLQQAGGTTMASMNQEILGRIPLIIPPLPEQRAIAHILGSLDDKIALNRKMNATLEAMAQALFQSWFVDFDPVIDKALAAGHEIPEPLAAKARRRAALGDRRKPLPPAVAALFPDRFVETEEMGWVPEGWVPGRLDQVADIVGGATPSTAQSAYFTENGIPWLSPKDLSGYTWKFIARGATDITAAGLKNSSARLMPKGTVLFSSRAPIGYVAIAENDVTTNQGFKSLVPKNGADSSFLYAFMKIQKAQIEAIATGSTFKEISASAMRAYPILIPSTSLLRTYEDLLAGGNKKQLLLQKETESLTALRDTLLPKLISGELRLRDAEATLQSVLP